MSQQPAQMQENESLLQMTYNSKFAERNGFDLGTVPSQNTSHQRGNSLVQSGLIKGFTSPTSTDVDLVVKKINSQYERLMNDVHTYKRAKKQVDPPTQC